MSTGNSGHSIALSLQPEALSFRFARTTAGGVHETWVISTSGLRSASGLRQNRLRQNRLRQKRPQRLSRETINPAFRLPDGRCVIPFPQPLTQANPTKEACHV